MVTQSTTFWEHLDELRASLIKIVIVTIALGLAAFVFKDELFTIVLAPKNDSFVTYKVFQVISDYLSLSNRTPETFSIKLINTGLAEQFIIHMKVAMYAGLMCASPYVLYLIFKFVSPALYMNERKYTLQVVTSGYVLFIIGVLLSYFLIFPLTFRFLGTYQVSSDVENMITLHSYIDTMMVLGLVMGIVFEIPIVCWLFAKLGFLSAQFMRHHRRYAIVIILVIAAIITPTADIFTLILMTMPMYLLYEVSILIVDRTISRSVLMNG